LRLFAIDAIEMYYFGSYFVVLRLIGQKTCYKTAIAIEISMAIAVLSFLKEDRGWTKNVFRMLVNS